MREFEQMEMQFFVKPGTEEEWYNHGRRLEKLARFTKWATKTTVHDHIKLAHYADAACVIEFNPMGFKELEEFTQELI